MDGLTCVLLGSTRSLPSFFFWQLMIIDIRQLSNRQSEDGQLIARLLDFRSVRMGKSNAEESDERAPSVG